MEDAALTLDALVAPLRADVVSGAAVVGRTGAEVVRRAVARIGAGDVEELRTRLAELIEKILDAQPAMAPLVTLGARVLGALPDEGPVEEAERAVLEATDAFRRDLEREADEVAAAAREVIPEGARVLTLSNSSTVRAALLGAASDLNPTVICLESRPVSEGRQLASQLAHGGVRVIFAVDAAAACLVDGAELVLLGADSVGDHGVVNKIGSRLVTELARVRRVPVYVLVDRTKLLPPGFPQPVHDPRPEKEVWKAPPGVKVWNRYFETVPLSRVTAVVTGSGVMDEDAVETARKRIPVPPELQAWADAHREGGTEASGAEPSPGSGAGTSDPVRG